MAKADTTMFAEHHCQNCQLRWLILKEKADAYQSANLAHARICALIAGHTLNSSCLDTKFSCESLQPCIEAVANDESLGMDSTFISNILAGAVFSLAMLLNHTTLDIVVVAHFGECRTALIEN
jgi:hypothetical protein